MSTEGIGAKENGQRVVKLMPIDHTFTYWGKVDDRMLGDSLQYIAAVKKSILLGTYVVSARSTTARNETTLPTLGRSMVTSPVPQAGMPHQRVPTAGLPQRHRSILTSGHTPTETLLHNSSTGRVEYSRHTQRFRRPQCLSRSSTRT